MTDQERSQTQPVAATSLDHKRVNVWLGLVLLLMALLSWRLIADLRAHQQMVQDRAELRNVRYGMLNADEWVQRISEVVEQKIRELQLKGEKREAIKRVLERALDTLITEADRHLKLQNTSGNWWDRTTGRIKESMRGALMDIDTVKAGIPVYAEQILNEFEKPETRREIGTFLTDMVTEVTGSTFGEVDETLREEILEHHHCAGSAQECEKAISGRLLKLDRRSRYLAPLVILCSLLMLSLARHGSDSANRFKWVLLSCGALLLLLCGILTPMIEVEARIAELRFVLMGQPLEFFDEVLYFQSKSILDVVSILMTMREIDTMVVGVLLTTFSVVFPILKLVASTVYVYWPRGLGRHAVVGFFAFKSSKWSMADVMVVAIFMAYIGFNGMISSQLDLVSHGATTAGIEVLTTNGTTLQLGFFMFLAFCVYGLLLSTLLESKMGKQSV